ncbi:MAG: RIO1 family regulatory kinase/ATPase [Actinomycetota bacterium]
MRPSPDWLVDEPYTDTDLGVLKSGKEAQVNVVERIGDDGRRCLLARKRYLPREVTAKGTLEAMGVQRASTFRNDVEYREGRQFRKSRDRRAVERMTAHGKRLLQGRWTGHEHETMRRLWEAGAPVPYPVSYGDDVFDLEYVGDLDGAAPQLYAAHLEGSDAEAAFAQVIAGLELMMTEGIAHGDLSAYNLLWWDQQVWFIDFPQAVDIAANPQGLSYVHRDIVNVCQWFARRGVEAAEDPDARFAELLVFL